ncbi:MAG: PLDc N-terminal domain-containing protein [Actinomycetota bacterium]
MPSSPTIFRRHDISGWGKAGWTALVFVLPILGILIYMVGRPREIGR